MLKISLLCLALLLLATGMADARSRVEVSTTSTSATGARLTFGGSEIDVICNVTLAATLRRLITKVRGAAVGDFTADTVNTCSSNFGSEVRADWLAPLSISYDSISGTLPTITGSRLEITGGYLWSIRTLFGTSACLYSGTIRTGSAENPLLALRILPGSMTLATRLSGNCPETIEFAGSLTATPTVTLRLLER